MDLSQFDDAQGGGTGRSVPTTPLSRTPPTITVVGASPPRPPTDTDPLQPSEQAVGDGGGQQGTAATAAVVEGDRGELVELTTGAGDVATLDKDSKVTGGY